MAITRYGVNDALAVKAWARALAVEALKATPIAPLIGKSADSVIHLKEESKEAGDKVTFGLRTQLIGDGVTENQTLEGNEESLTTYSDSIMVGELAHGVRVKGEKTIDNQRILFDTRKEAKAGLKDWFAKRLSMGFFLHVGGYRGATYTNTGQTVDYTKPQFNLNNSIVAASSGRILWSAQGASETNTADEGLESDDIFDLRLIDYAKERAEASGVPIRPVMVDGEPKFICYLHP